MVQLVLALVEITARVVVVLLVRVVEILVMVVMAVLVAVILVVVHVLHALVDVQGHVKMGVEILAQGLVKQLVNLAQLIAEVPAYLHVAITAHLLVLRDALTPV